MAIKQQDLQSIIGDLEKELAAASARVEAVKGEWPSVAKESPWPDLCEVINGDSAAWQHETCGEIERDRRLKELNDHLASTSYVCSGATATQEDFDFLAQAPGNVGAQFHHVKRWAHHIRSLKTKFPFRKWPSAAKDEGEAQSETGEDQAKLEGLLPGAEVGKETEVLCKEEAATFEPGKACERKNLKQLPARRLTS
eukprot:s2127_g7.t1